MPGKPISFAIVAVLGCGLAATWFAQRVPKPSTTAASQSSRLLTSRAAYDALGAEQQSAIEDVLKNIAAGTQPSYGRKWGEEFHADSAEPLPLLDHQAKPLRYREYYVRKAPNDLSEWGPRRLLISSDNHVYYTPDHYETFMKVR